MTKETEADENDHLHGSEDDTTNNILDITLAYNVTDWTAGYFGEIGGYTVGCMWPISYIRNLQGSRNNQFFFKKFVTFWSWPHAPYYTAYFGAAGSQTELRDVKTRVVLSADQSTRVTLRTLHQTYLRPPLG